MERRAQETGTSQKRELHTTLQFHVNLFAPQVICEFLFSCFNVTPFIISLLFFKNPSTAQAYYSPVLSRFQIVTALLSLLKLIMEGFNFEEFFFRNSLFEKKKNLHFSVHGVKRHFCHAAARDAYHWLYLKI